MSLKREIRVLGIDDSPFDKFRDRYVTVVGAFFRGGNYMDGLVSTRISVDGNNSTKKLARMINSTKFKSQLKCIMIDGINMGGFNVIDIHKLSKSTKVPVIVVVRRKPDLPNIKRVLARLGMSRKISLLDKAGAPLKCGKIYIQFAGLDLHEASEIVRITATHSYLPEPIRVAHLIGAGLVFGESKGRA
jgi:endonuclease V-like protein UPF0215 family